MILYLHDGTEMDPNFSVLLGQEKRDQCEKDKKDKSISGGAIAGVVIGIVGFIALSAFIILFIYPRFMLWKQTRVANKLSSTTSSSSLNNSNSVDSEMVHIEKRQEMAVNTASGNYVVRF